MSGEPYEGRRVINKNACAAYTSAGEKAAFKKKKYSLKGHPFLCISTENSTLNVGEVDCFQSFPPPNSFCGKILPFFSSRGSLSLECVMIYDLL